MAKPQTDWQHHIAAFRAGKQSLSQYCAEAGIKPSTFHYHLYKSSKPKRRRQQAFKEFVVQPALVIERDVNGALRISGLDPAHLSAIIAAWSNAVS